MDAMAAIRKTFFEECEEQLAELESGLMAMNEGTADRETVNAVFRAVHSIKGGAGAFKLTDLVAFAHTFETTLDYIRSDRLVATPDAMCPFEPYGRAHFGLDLETACTRSGSAQPD